MMGEQKAAGLQGAMFRGCVLGQNPNAWQQFAEVLLANMGMTVMTSVPFWMTKDLCLGHLQAAA